MSRKNHGHGLAVIAPGEKTLYERQIQLIADLMSKSQWTTKKSAELGKKWKVSGSCMRTRASEASRRIRYLMDDQKEAAREIILAGLAWTITQAAKDKQYNSVVKAFDLQSRMLGLLAPAQIEVSGSLAMLSDADLERKRAELIAKLHQVPWTVEAGDDPAH